MQRLINAYLFVMNIIYHNEYSYQDTTASKQQIIEAANDSARQLGYEKLRSSVRSSNWDCEWSRCLRDLSRSASRV